MTPSGLEPERTIRSPEPQLALNTHVNAAMRSFIDAHPGWLTVVRLPAYAPDLNLAAGTVGQLATIAKNRLKSIQYRPQLIDAFLTQTGSPSSRHRHQTLAFL